jgi:hypothetical protein
LSLMSLITVLCLETSMPRIDGRAGLFLPVSRF